jgi:hypothetical protein
VLSGADGQPAEFFSPGDDVALQLTVEAPEPIEPPILAIELRDAVGALLSRVDRDLGALGWDPADGSVDVRFDVRRLPLVEGRFQFNVSLTDRERSRRYHSVEKAAEFVVVPQGDAHGFVLFEGEWSLEASEGSQPLRVLPDEAQDPSPMP